MAFAILSSQSTIRGLYHGQSSYLAHHEKLLFLSYTAYISDNNLYCMFKSFENPDNQPSQEMRHFKESILPPRTYEEIAKEIDSNLATLDEALRENKEAVIEAINASIEMYGREKDAHIIAVDSLRESLAEGSELVNALTQSDINILNERIARISEYINACTAARQGRYHVEKPRFHGENPSPSLHGMPLETYRKWLKQNTYILEGNHDQETIELFGKKVAQYESDQREISATIQKFQNEIIELEYKDTPSPLIALRKNDVEILIAAQLDIEQYLGAYRKAVTQHQEEALQS